MELSPRVHDLLHVDRAAFDDASLPVWARVALDAVPWVVVRRAAPPASDVLAVGIRGASRCERHATVVLRRAVRAIRTPESLRPTVATRALPIVATLARVRADAEALGIVCGPGGSVGFELATDAHAISHASDLDLVVRPAPRARLATFAERLRALDVRVDALVEFPDGGIALDEYVRGGPYLVRSADGPRAFALRA